MKRASSGKSYFNCTLQREKSVVRAVCFSPEKHFEMNNAQCSKSPVRLQNIRLNEKNGKKDVVILKQTKIATLPSIDCTYSEDLDTSSLTTDIANLRQVAPEQLVSLKVEVAYVDSVKKITTQYGSFLMKQELIVRDPTGSVKLILWEDNVETLELHKTYLLQNVRVKALKNEKYINTAKSEKFLFSVADEFEANLAPVDNDITGLATSSVHGKIVGVLNASYTLACLSCFKKVIPKSEKMSNCQTCKMMQYLKSCFRQWYLRVLIETTQNEKL